MNFIIKRKSISELKEEAADEKAKAELAQEEIKYRKQINEFKAIEKERDKMIFQESILGKTTNILMASARGIGTAAKGLKQELKKAKKKKSKPANKKYNIFTADKKPAQSQGSFLEKAFGK
jgi:uncharacterized protein (DUF3084 family)